MRSLVIVCALLCGACATAGGQTGGEAPAEAGRAANTLTPEEIADGWRLLFDGETTAGWGGYNPSIATDRVILAMAAAHILTDIPVALAELGCCSSADYFAIEQVVNNCSQQWMGNIRHLLQQLAVQIGVPGANSIIEWRTKVWNYVCNCGPHPGE